MRKWIRFEPRCCRFHWPAAGALITICGLRYADIDVRDTTDHPPAQCSACRRRLTRTPYLAVTGVS